ncbi:MAG: DUF3108 domain-containing protein [Thermoanaerobaculia bacterium]
MKIIRTLAVAAVVTLASMSVASAADLNCQGPANVEDFRYSWRVRGGLRWVAGLVFPTSGVGNLKTTFPAAAGSAVHSELLITAPNGRAGGFYSYESDMDPRGNRTLMTYHGYAWGAKARNERTIFDYVKRLMRIRKQTPEKVEDKVKALPARQDQVRDVLTAIYFLRHNASSLTGPMQTSVFSDGKEYPVVFRPLGERRSFVIDGKSIAATGFEIVDAPGGKKWPGGVRVWLSDDTRRIPFRIEIQQSVATLQLDLQSVESCAFLSARK